jgi:hypothetical protein
MMTTLQLSAAAVIVTLSLLIGVIECDDKYREVGCDSVRAAAADDGERAAELA